MSRNDNLNKFDELIEELKRIEERPSIPPAFEAELRGQLLNQYERSRLAWGSVGQWVGTAVALSILGLIVIYAWGIMSRPAPAVAPVSVTRPVQPTADSTVAPVELEAASSSFKDGPLLTRHTVSATRVNPGDSLEITLFWDGEAESATNIAVHLANLNGNLVSQADQPLAEEMNLTLFIPDATADGVYEIVVIQYDAATGVRQDSFLLQEIEVGTAVATPPKLAATGDVWFISAQQQGREAASDDITVSVTVGYYVINTDEEVWLKLLYAAPDWETRTDGRLPIDGMGEAVLLTEPEGTHTFTYSASPAEMRQITGVDQPVVIAQLGTFGEEQGQSREYNILASSICSIFKINLDETNEVTVTIPSEVTQRNTLEIVSITPPVGSILRGTTTFEITVQYHLTSLETAHLVTKLLPMDGRAAVWGDDRQVISRGEGEITYSFQFTPSNANQRSDLLVDIQIIDPEAEATVQALASDTPHDNFPSDAYHFEP